MKRIIAVLLIAVLGFSAAAATPKQKTPSKKALAAENEKLRNSLDSLTLVIDSLNQRRYLEDESLLAVVEGNNEKDVSKFTIEQTDSLLTLWYENVRHNDYKAADKYDMDAVHFTSDVPDSELERRLVAMNSYITLPFNETVKNYMILYSEKLATRMERTMGLAEYYFPIIEDTFNKYGLPHELKYLAVVESMLSPTATSRAGAKGMWQFMYRTAQSYGLKINSFVDERMDVEKSVDAAARYLEDAYSIYGDWSLAISSYNCGAGNVSKAIRRAGGSRDFWSIYPYLPRETRGYMPAFVGAMYAMTYAKEYGIETADVGMPAQVDTFEIHKNLHFKQINEVVGVPVDELEYLNPEYYRDIVPGSEGTCILNLPYSWSAAFLAADPDSLYKHNADSLLSEKVMKDADSNSPSSRITYRVKSGDYLGRIASRYHVTVKQLMNWNHLRSSSLRAGQILYIYTRGGGPSSSASSSASKATSSASGSSVSPSASSSSASTSSAASSSSSSSQSSSTSGSSTSSSSSTDYIVYTVKAGDSFYSIAKNYSGVSAQNIMDYNHITSSNLRPGMKIRIPKL